MPRRLNFHAANPKAIQAMIGVEKAVRQSGLETSLLELVKTRTSQINHCAFCLEIHTREARAADDHVPDLRSMCVQCCGVREHVVCGPTAGQSRERAGGSPTQSASRATAPGNCMEVRQR